MSASICPGVMVLAFRPAITHLLRGSEGWEILWCTKASASGGCSRPGDIAGWRSRTLLWQRKTSSTCCRRSRPVLSRGSACADHSRQPPGGRAFVRSARRRLAGKSSRSYAAWRKCWWLSLSPQRQFVQLTSLMSTLKGCAPYPRSSLHRRHSSHCWPSARH